MPEPRVYPVADRPDVEVLHDGRWVPGILRAWFHRDDAWVADVAYTPTPGETYIDTFPADQVRQGLS